MSEGVGGRLAMRCIVPDQLRDPVDIIDRPPDVASFIDSALVRRELHSPAPRRRIMGSGIPSPAPPPMNVSLTALDQALVLARPALPRARRQDSRRLTHVYGPCPRQ